MAEKIKKIEEEIRPDSGEEGRPEAQPKGKKKKQAKRPDSGGPGRPDS